MNKSIALLVTSSLAGIAISQPASAQSIHGKASAESNSDIIVTARKRQESILKVPIIETAVTETSLNNFGTHDIKTLSSQIPTLAIGSNLGDFGAQVSVRGVGNTTLNATVDQAVSLNIDGLQVSQGLAYSAGLFDVGQVEVLEGPQALFYGKSTTGGVISLNSNDPTDQYEIIGRMGYEGEAAEKKTELILSGPVSDSLKLRLATSYSSMDGFFRNRAVGIPAAGGLTPLNVDYAPQRELIMRGTVLWSPSDRLDLKLKANYDHLLLDGDDGQEEITSCPNGTSFPGLPPFISPQDDCKIGKDIFIVSMNPADFPGIRNNGVPFNHMKQIFGTLEANYKLSDSIKLTSVTGFYRLLQSDLFNGTDAGAAGPIFAFDNNFKMRNISEEVRANSDSRGPLNFTVGGFYQDAQADQYLNGIYNQAIIPALYFQQGYNNVHTTTYSLFGQVRYKIFPELELAAGARWTDETKDLVSVATQPRFSGIVLIPVGPVATGVPKISSRHVNPEFTLTYTPTDNLTLFGSYKEASKSGGFQTTIIQPAGTDLSFKDETVKGGEIGIKGSLADRQITFSISGYDYKYSNLQVGENLVTNEGLIVRTINAGTAKVRGIEFAASYRPQVVSGLTLHAAANYNHARFGTFLNGPCWGGQTISQGCNLDNSNPLLVDPVTGKNEYQNQNLSGRPLIRAPDWTFNAGFDYELPLPSGMSVNFSSNTSYSGRYYTDLAERSDMIQSAFVKTNASITFKGAEDSWELAFIGNNLGNKLTTGYCANSEYRTGDIPAGQITGGTTSGPAGVDELACNVDRGRELWLRLTLRPLALLK